MKKWVVEKIQKPPGEGEKKGSGRWIIVDENKKKDH